MEDYGDWMLESSRSSLKTQPLTKCRLLLFNAHMHAHTRQETHTHTHNIDFWPTHTSPISLASFQYKLSGRRSHVTASTSNQSEERITWWYCTSANNGCQSGSKTNPVVSNRHTNWPVQQEYWKQTRINSSQSATTTILGYSFSWHKFGSIRC